MSTKLFRLNVTTGVSTFTFWRTLRVTFWNLLHVVTVLQSCDNSNAILIIGLIIEIWLNFGQNYAVKSLEMVSLFLKISEINSFIYSGSYCVRK